MMTSRCGKLERTILILHILMRTASITSKGLASYDKKAHYTTAHHDLHRSLRSVYTALHDFEVAIPELVNEFGKHVSHKLHVRVRRNSDPGVKHLKVQAHGHDFHIELIPNENLLHSSFTVKRIRRQSESGQSEKDEFVDVDRDCHYKGKILSHESRPAAISLCHGATGLLRTISDDLLIEPIHPGIRHGFPGNQQPHIVYKKKQIVRDEDHFCGNPSVHPMPVSMEKEVQYRYLSDGSFVISPVNVSHEEIRGRTRLDGSGTRSKRNVESRKRKVVETLVVADPEFLRKHKTDRTDVTTYILTVMNMVNGLFRDGTLDTEIEVTLIGLILMENSEDLELGHKAGKSLAKFCKWQSTVNTTVRKPDHSILLTGINICVDKDEPCDTLGLAEVGGMCNPLESCTINEDTGLGLAFTVAHETGHSFGMIHDGQANSCLDRGGHVMSPTINTVNGVFTWSSCSRRTLEKFLKTSQANCLQDALEDNTAGPEIELPRELPGQLYGADEQCKLQFGRDRSLCSPRYINNLDYICVSLWCKRPDRSCESKHLPASEGTPCGIRKWCRRGKCVPLGSGGPKPVNGGWSTYGSWSECSKTCGVGVSVRMRQCNNPEPMYGGRHCDGDNTLYELCSTLECPPSALDYRSVQCAEYNTKPYRSQYFDWIPYIKFWKYGANRCELLCEAEGFGFFDRLSTSVKDGTSCDDETYDVCIAGRCEPVGCDWILHSDAVPDLCGVCKGDNSTCHFIKGTFREHIPDSGYYFVAKLPIGAATIKIWEDDYRSHAYLAVKSANDKSRYYLNGDWEVDMYDEATFAGSKWQYLRDIGKPETLTAKGPITEPVIIEGLIVNQNPGISYSYYISEIDNALPHDLAKSVRKQPDSYTWQEDFTVCSKSCAGGFRNNNITCIRNGVDVVDDSFCPIEFRPTSRKRQCNTRPCPERWEEGTWTPCSQTCGNGTQTREIFCIQSTHSGERNLSVENCNQKGIPSKKRSCREEKCARWKPGRWSECSKSCGRGQRTRPVFCRAGGVILTNDKCESEKRPRTKRGCRVAKCQRHYQWLISAWGKCSVTCGEGLQRRRVTCSRRNRHGGFRHAKSKRCKRSQKPRITAKKPCVRDPCGVTTPLPEATALTNGTESAANDMVETWKRIRRPTTPIHHKPRWITGNWKQCSATCGGGTQSRKVSCTVGYYESDGCTLSSKPHTTRNCNTFLCPSESENGDFCLDRYSWCNQVVYHRTCSIGYFKTLCCISCADA